MELDDLVAELEAETSTPANFNEVYDKFASDLYNEVCSWSNIKRDAAMADATQRFSTALPLRLVNNVTVALIGAGGLGNWIWRVLLGMGFTNLAIFDDDKVGIENIGPQAHNLIDIDYPKVEAIRRAALAYRGVNLRVFEERVMTDEDLFNTLGYTPDIIIGATDSADFRNSMIHSLKDNCDVTLFIDLRMSLGDWNAYITTPKLIQQDYEILHFVYDKYIQEACFSQEEAVHEACTARAITYTGANVASYVGAFLHWWFTEGRTKNALWFRDTFYSPYRADSKTFNWEYTHSSRDFSPETQTVAQHVRITKVQKLSAEVSAFEQYFKANYCVGRYYTASGSMSAYRGLSAEGHDCLTFLRTMYAITIDLDTNTFEFTDMSDMNTQIPPLPVRFQYGKPGWEEIACFLGPDWPDRERVDIWLRGAWAYVLTFKRGGTIELRHVSKPDDNNVIRPYDDPIPFREIVGTKWRESTDLGRSLTYTYESEPEPEPEPEQETVQLSTVQRGQDVLLRGDRYTVADKLGHMVKLTYNNGERSVYAADTVEVTCC